jgi:AcrR family transcriptional regulator
MARVGLSPARLAVAGAELADSIGFDQVTLSALARHFDVQVASLYSHVRNSADLKLRIATLALNELAGVLAAAVAGRSGAEALAALADVYRDYARQHPGRYAATRHTPPHPVLGAEYVNAGRRHSELIRAVLRGYNLAEPAQTDAVRLLGATIHGYVALELAGSFDYSDPPAADSWSRIVQALDTLLHTWQP